MSHHESHGGPPRPHIVNSNSNFNVNIGGNITNNNPVNTTVNYYHVSGTTPNAMATIEKALSQHHLPGAVFEAQPANAGCMQGTRVQFLEQIVKLLTARTGPHIAWVAGMAGTGKTSIALTLCRILSDENSVYVGGSFFCSRSTGTVERTDVQRIIPTLATIFARQLPDYAKYLAKQVAEEPDIAHRSVRSQVNRLLALPLADFGRADGQIVFVVDALDECSDQVKLVELIDALADFKSKLSVKFLLTSRPEMFIRRTPISNPNLSSILQLHTIDLAQTTADLHLYISETLARASNAATWYTQFDIETLVQQSCRLFIFASTALKYVLGRGNEQGRRDRLQKVTKTVSRGTALTAHLDQIYDLVLTEASRPDEVDNDELEDTRRVLACVLTARASLSIQALADLIGTSSASLRGALERLPSLVYVPDDDVDPGIQTLHASFGDYMFDRAASGIRIAPASGHHIFAGGCLRRLSQDDLCFNISRSRSSFESNTDSVASQISLSLVYACLHWAHHHEATSSSSTFDEEVGRIFQQKLLFWLEALSVLKKVNVASGLLRIAASVVQLPAIALFLSEANSFVASSYNAIAQSAPHIYLSALPFAAKDSLIWKYFGSRCAGVVSVETFGINRHSQSLVMTLNSHGVPVAAIAYSRGGRNLALLCCPSLPSFDILHDDFLRVWDTTTGEEITTLFRVKHGGILAIAFTLNDTGIAVCDSWGNLGVWDISTGLETRYWLCATPIEFATYSPDGILVAGSWNGTVYIWSTSTGEQVFSLQGPKSQITGIAFSSNGRLAVAFSKPGTIHVWNSCTGLTIGSPLVIDDPMKQAEIQSFSISSDGNVLAVSLSKMGRIDIWDMNTRIRASVALNSDCDPYSLAFSPNGLHLAAVNHDQIRFWDWRTEQEVATPLHGHSDRIHSICYSPDGTYLASASSDHTIRMWDVGGSGTVTRSLPHPDLISCVALAPDNTFIVSNSNDDSVHVWNVQRNYLTPQKPMRHQSKVVSVAISPNGQMIASASEPVARDPRVRMIRLWDAQTGELLYDMFEDRGSIVHALEFSPDMTQLGSASTMLLPGSSSSTVYVWNLATRTPSTFGTRERNYIPSKLDSCLPICFSPDGRLLAAAAGGVGEVQIWWTHSGRPLDTSLQMGQPSVSFIAFSRDGRKVITGSMLDGTFQVSDIHNGEVLSVHMDDVPMMPTLPFGFYATFDWLACSPNERFMARLLCETGESSQTLRLWDTAVPGVMTAVHVNNVRAGAAVFSKDSRCIIIGAASGIMVWKVEAVMALAAGSRCDPLAQLLRDGLREDGWVKGPSDELLFWIPPEYREYVQLPPCALMISKHRVVLTGDAAGLHYGDNWTSCWR